jgi:hypothetical protein
MPNYRVPQVVLDKARQHQETVVRDPMFTVSTDDECYAFIKADQTLLQVWVDQIVGGLTDKSTGDRWHCPNAFDSRDKLNPLRTCSFHRRRYLAFKLEKIQKSLEMRLSS